MGRERPGKEEGVRGGGTNTWIFSISLSLGLGLIDSSHSHTARTCTHKDTREYT